MSFKSTSKTEWKFRTGEKRAKRCGQVLKIGKGLLLGCCCGPDMIDQTHRGLWTVNDRKLDLTIVFCSTFGIFNEIWTEVSIVSHSPHKINASEIAKKLGGDGKSVLSGKAVVNANIEDILDSINKMFE